MKHDVHHATFTYNYVNRAVWGEKSCVTPLQDLDELHGKLLKSMVYSTVSSDKNHAGVISNMAFELGFMLSFIQKYDPQWLVDKDWEFQHKRRSSCGVSAEKYLLFKTNPTIAGVDLIDGTISAHTLSENFWETHCSFKLFSDFIHYHEIYTSVCGRFNRLLVEQSSDVLASKISKCRRLFVIPDGQVISEARRHTLDDWRRVLELALDLYLDVTDQNSDDLRFEIRHSCYGDEALPLRLLAYEVLSSVDSQKQQIL